ncbi:MAG: glycosyltransferase family 39 protein, partial [Chloroflexi bacterium]|nr:glycosyltransferase family 39 protein [Chloroflexota bacterium]
MKGVMAREVLEGKGFPIFFPAYTGREPLYIYLSAGAMAAFGEGIFAVRLNSVFLGILTLAVAFALSRAMFGTRVALYASAFLAVSLWHVIASRNGYRAVSQPLFEALALWFLWRGLQSQRRRDFLLGGAALGLVLYTYTAGRVFPAMLVLFFALQLLTNWRWARGQIRGMGLFLACGAVVAVPLALYFWVHPADFFGRAGQVSVFNPAFSQGDPLDRLRQSVIETLGMFSQRGDPNWRFNLRDRPVFDPLSAAFFYFGLALCLVRAVRSKGLERAAYTLLPLWLLVMLIPAMLTAEDVPASQRAIGIIPAVYILPALGLAWLTQRFPGWPFALVVGIFFAILGGVTYRDYFVAWAQAPVAYQERQAEMVDVAQYLKQSPWDGRFFISADYPQHPTVAFLAPEQYDRSHWFDARQAIALSPEGVGAIYLFTDRSPPA